MLINNKCGYMNEQCTNNEIKLHRNSKDRGLRTAMSLKQKFRPYSVLVVLLTSASPGFNDQVKIPAPEKL